MYQTPFPDATRYPNSMSHVSSPFRQVAWRDLGHLSLGHMDLCATVAVVRDQARATTAAPMMHVLQAGEEVRKASETEAEAKHQGQTASESVSIVVSCTIVVAGPQERREKMQWEKTYWVTKPLS